MVRRKEKSFRVMNTAAVNPPKRASVVIAADGITDGSTRLAMYSKGAKMIDSART